MDQHTLISVELKLQEEEANNLIEDDLEEQDILVPVTILSTKDKDNTNGQGNDNNGDSNQSQKRTIKIFKSKSRKCKRTEKQNCSDGKQKPVRKIRNKRGGTGPIKKADKAIEGKEEDEDDDEFEDEREFEGTKFGIRTAQERRRRLPIGPMLPLPVLRRASLSLQEKIEIIKELANGAKQSWVCKTKCLPKSTVQSIWKNRVKIQEAVEKIGLGRKRCRRAQHEDVELRLVEWIDTLKSQNVPVNGPQLRAKAQVFAKQMGITEFRSSTGWLDKFKTRHNIAFKKSIKQSNSLAADKKIALDWVTKVWPETCDGYFPENIFNADEFGLYWNALPEQTTKLIDEQCHDGRFAQNRFTVLLCSNSDGSEKRKLVVVGNYKLNGVVNTNNLPVKYQQDSKSWLTKLLFVLELRQWDSELRASGRNILLILDNSPVHTVTETFSNIKLVFLPPIVARILQPLDHGVIQIVKAQYRRLLLEKVTRKYQQEQEINKSTDSLNVSLLEALSMLDCAWIDVKSKSIADCFKTSNLQSVSAMSPSSSADITDVNGSQSQDNTDAIFDLELMERASLAGIPMLPDLSFLNYVHIDSRLQVTDYMNEHGVNGADIDSKHLNELVFGLSANNNNSDIPRKSDVQNYLLSIRNWVASLPSNIDRSVHQSIGVLENFVLRQLNEQYQHCENNSDLINNLNEINVGGSRVILSAVQNHDQSNVPLNSSSILSVPLSSNSSSNGTTITFTISDSVEQSELLQSANTNSPLPQHIIDQQQFFAYLT